MLSFGCIITESDLYLDTLLPKGDVVFFPSTVCPLVKPRKIQFQPTRILKYNALIHSFSTTRKHTIARLEVKTTMLYIVQKAWPEEQSIFSVYHTVDLSS